MIYFFLFFAYLFVQWLLNPEFKLFKEKIQHNIDEREVKTDKEIQDMKDDIEKLKKEVRKNE